jgi:NAD(P)-dependent dehydrogenase (short-subunit alcohol dehydrogenase family)
MREFAGRVAVITGGAGTFGRAMAARFAREGMRIVLADRDAASLNQATEELRRSGVEAIGVPTDVSRAESVDALARATIERFGAVHLLANNAGVAALGAAWESTVADWQWTLGVNLWGVIHGVRTFTPIMLAQGGEAHILNTASVAGLISPPGMAAYNVSKHAVVAFSETLHQDLARAHAKVRCSVICPAYFPSGISNAERQRPSELANVAPPSAHQLALQATLDKAVSSGRISAGDIAELVFQAVREERFYVLSHPKIRGAIQARMEDLLAGTNPRDPLAL